MADPILPIVPNLSVWVFLEVLRPDMRLIFHIDMFSVFRVSDVNQDTLRLPPRPGLPSGDFANEADAFSFLDAKRHKHFVNKLQ